MDRDTFEDKYAYRWGSVFSPDEFKEDLKTMLITEIGKAVVSMTDSENSKMNHLEEYD